MRPEWPGKRSHDQIGQERDHETRLARKEITFPDWSGKKIMRPDWPGKRSHDQIGQERDHVTRMVYRNRSQDQRGL